MSESYSYNPACRPILNDFLADRDSETRAMRHQIALLIRDLEFELADARKELDDAVSHAAEAERRASEAESRVEAYRDEPIRLQEIVAEEDYDSIRRVLGEGVLDEPKL